MKGLGGLRGVTGLASVVGMGLVLGLGLGMAGCKAKTPAAQNEEGAQSSNAAPRPAVALDPATLGSVEGVINLSGKAPTPVKIDTSMDPACAFGGGGDTYTQQYVVHDNKMANVYVYVKSGPAAAMAEGDSGRGPVVMDQKGCSYVPHVIAVMMGGSVEFRNDDPTMHNIHMTPTVAGNPVVDISEGPRAVPQTRRFPRPEVMIPVRCNNHPWMSAFINVSQTPFFAVTGTDGKFELKGMPAGTYTIGAVQEKLGEQDVTVTVKPQAETKTDFTFAMK